jgi:hypothetical protein
MGLGLDDISRRGIGTQVSCSPVVQYIVDLCRNLRCELDIRSRPYAAPIDMRAELLATSWRRSRRRIWMTHRICADSLAILRHIRLCRNRLAAQVEASIEDLFDPSWFAGPLLCQVV